MRDSRAVTSILVVALFGCTAPRVDEDTANAADAVARSEHAATVESADGDKTVVEIRLVGIPETARSSLATKVGDPVRVQIISDDLSRLWTDWRTRGRVVTEDAGGDGIVLIFEGTTDGWGAGILTEKDADGGGTIVISKRNDG